ncbi:hypothetical protein BKM31_00025 [[Actinomadura] parvosata subsp. kistnae]|uniref:Uncharacterized protein n=1 Tax=[Actinomadura] parvosata subsp. kistnae TaxID=1909395 RepID=A0A1U9ZQ93_9ACTN|nr:hypothetical protein BKM31_00025 [Nonomuraea sp. ATCC 55076]
MLGAALTGRLADFDRTAFTAVMVATRLRHEGFPAADLPGEVEAHCAEDLRWPARLADLDGSNGARRWSPCGCGWPRWPAWRPRWAGAAPSISRSPPRSRAWWPAVRGRPVRTRPAKPDHRPAPARPDPGPG